jgi:hypothetical protein
MKLGVNASALKFSASLAANVAEQDWRGPASSAQRRPIYIHCAFGKKPGQNSEVFLFERLGS